MEVLLAIKPQYAAKIFDGTKRYEFRKSIFKSNNISKVIVYASNPIKKVIGEFDIEEILKDEPEKLWNITKNFSGVTKDFYDLYFGNRKDAYAIKIKSTKKYKNPKCLKSDYNIMYPPQSFRYMESKALSTTCK